MNNKPTPIQLSDQAYELLDRIRKIIELPTSAVDRVTRLWGLISSLPWKTDNKPTASGVNSTAFGANHMTDRNCNDAITRTPPAKPTPGERLYPDVAKLYQKWIIGACDNQMILSDAGFETFLAGWQARDAELSTLTKQRDELMEALKKCKDAMVKSKEVGCTDHLDCCDDYGAFWHNAVENADETIACIEAQKTSGV